MNAPRFYIRTFLFIELALRRIICIYKVWHSCQLFLSGITTLSIDNKCRIWQCSHTFCMTRLSETKCGGRRVFTGRPASLAKSESKRWKGSWSHLPDSFPPSVLPLELSLCGPCPQLTIFTSVPVTLRLPCPQAPDLLPTSGFTSKWFELLTAHLAHLPPRPSAFLPSVSGSLGT